MTNSYQDRVREEHLDLSDKIAKLEAFLSTSSSLLTVGEEKNMKLQLGAMKFYKSILESRIEGFLSPERVGDSADDTRVKNNTMRHQYRTLSDREKQDMREIKDLGQLLIDKIGQINQGRGASIAITNIEQGVMWAVKQVTQ